VAVPEGRAILCQSIPAVLAQYCIKGAKFDETNWNRHSSPFGAPSPAHQRTFIHMLDEIIEASIAIVRAIFKTPHRVPPSHRARSWQPRSIRSYEASP